MAFKLTHYHVRAQVEKLNIFLVTFQLKIFFFCETLKPATNSDGVFIIPSFANDSENQWVVFISP